MTTESPGRKLSPSPLAAADLSAKQFYGVKINTSGLIALAGAGETCIGVLQNKPEASQPAEVMVSGRTKMIAAGVIAPGALVACDADGKATTASKAVTDTQAGSATDALIGSNVIGIAMNTANSAAGDLIPVELLHLGAVPTTAA